MRALFQRLANENAVVDPADAVLHRHPQAHAQPGK